MTVFDSAREIVAHFWLIFGLLMHARRHIQVASPSFTVSPLAERYTTSHS
jgi:hypothetical protein